MPLNPDCLSRAQIVALLEERDILREAVEIQRRALLPIVTLPACWGLSPRQSDMLLAIRGASPNVAHRERIMMAVYGKMNGDAPDVRVLDVMIARVRQKLARAGSGISIETSWGRGWRLDAENAARLQDHIDRAFAPFLVAAE